MKRAVLPAAAVILAAAGILSAALSPDQTDPSTASSTAPSRAALAPSGGLFADSKGFFAPSSGLTLPAPGAVPQAALQQVHPRLFEFYFTRAIYSSFGRDSWRTDYPEADWFFSQAVRRLAGLDAYEEWGSNPVWLGDVELRRHPFIYALEVGSMALAEEEVIGLRNFLTSGGFLMVDDFWGTREWNNFEREISRVLPGRAMVEIPLTHSLFSIFYNIDEIWQVPNVRNGQMGGPTYEQDGFVPQVRGIFDEDGRLMVVIHWNTDLGDAWEWADDPWYPLKYSTYAFEVAINTVIYAMTH